MRKLTQETKGQRNQVVVTWSRGQITDSVKIKAFDLFSDIDKCILNELFKSSSSEWEETPLPSQAGEPRRLQLNEVPPSRVHLQSQHQAQGSEPTLCTALSQAMPGSNHPGLLGLMEIQI